jgi:cytochrome oxidase Cu insertion factor (SCO1/SenC/PrrC family)
MNRRDVLKAAAGFCLASSGRARSAQNVTSGNAQVGGDLGVLSHNGHSARHLIEGKYRLVYFGTAHRLPNCSVDLMVLQDVSAQIAKKCGPESVTLFVHPEHDPVRHPPADNIKSYIEKPGSKILGLSGKQDRVIEIARGYRARYFLGQNNVPNNHTRFVYLMAPDGSNLAIAAADFPADILAGEFAKSISKDRSERNLPACSL